MPSLSSQDIEIDFELPRNVDFLLFWASYFDEDETRADPWKKFMLEIGRDLFVIQVDFFLDELLGMNDFIMIRRLFANQPNVCENLMSKKFCHCNCKKNLHDFYLTMCGLSQRLLRDMWESFV